MENTQRGNFGPGGRGEDKYRFPPEVNEGGLQKPAIDIGEEFSHLNGIVP
ncbi:MAG: hypothetical protein JWN37_409 [Candidatus Nomurabacteria bacterium]|nr:hypothetical protein [Candidatus Nomurabacteria bacterium]